MADLAYPASPAPGPGFIQGRAPERYTTAEQAQAPGHSAQDFRFSLPTTGTITDRVVFKSGASELPFANGRVWMLRLADGYKAWEGWSDSAGWYTATGLELSVEYVAVGIDPYRNHRATGAGPVMAT
jgi:hypothetical protein